MRHLGLAIMHVAKAGATLRNAKEQERSKTLKVVKVNVSRPPQTQLCIPNGASRVFVKYVRTDFVFNLASLNEIKTKSKLILTISENPDFDGLLLLCLHNEGNAMHHKRQMVSERVLKSHEPSLQIGK